MATASTQPGFTLQLPQELLACVLRHVDLQQRLGSCSLVCRAWRAAAGAATSTVQVRFGRQKGQLQADSLQQWLSAHGAAVAKLEVDGADANNSPVRLQLPCAALPHLEQLRMYYCHVAMQQGSSSSSSSSSAGPSLACLTSLTAMTVLDVECDVVDGFAGLCALTGMQRLQLGSLHLPHPRPLPQGDAYTEWVAHQQQHDRPLLLSVLSGLQQLSQMTQLELCDHVLSLDVAPAGLFRQQLQELRLRQAEVVCPEVLQDLPPSLTRLELNWRADSQLSSSSVPSLARLTALQYLDVDAAQGDLHPGFISSMQQLRTLSLLGSMLGAGQQQQQQQQQQPGDVAAAAAAPFHALLDALPGLSQLETLIVHKTSEEDLAPLPAGAAAKYTALLPASPQLTRMDLLWDQGSLLPGDCWQHVLAGGWQLPQLKQLTLGVPGDRGGPGDNGECLVSRVEQMVPCLGAAELARLVQRCPALQLLSIPGLVQFDAEDEDEISPLTSLIALTALTHLVVGGDVVDDDTVREALGALTNLQQLQIYNSRVTDHGLLGLAALRQLTLLQVFGSCISGELLQAEYDGMVEAGVELQTVGTTGMCDVWLQLLALCTYSFYCSKEATRTLVEAYAMQQTGYQELREHMHKQSEALEAAIQEKLELQRWRDTVKRMQAETEQDIEANKSVQAALQADMQRLLRQQQQRQQEQEQRDELLQLLHAAQAQLAAAKARSESLQQQLAAAEVRGNGLQQQQEQQQQHHHHQEQKNASNARGDELQQQLCAAQAQLAAAKARSDCLQQQLAAAEARADGLQQQLHASHAQVAAAEARAYALQQQLAAAEARAQAL